MVNDQGATGLILQHGVDGPPGVLGEWLAECDLAHDVHATWRDPLPEPGAYGWIASLGSESTPGKPGAPDWVEAEIAFLRAALDAEVPILGLCFGGQTLASALGGSVGPSDPPEIGWLEIETDEPELIPAGPWMHWHYDLLSAPPGSETVARSPAGVAAFVHGRSLGLQFHPEATPEVVDVWARLEREALLARGLEPETLAEQGRRHGTGAAAAARRLFEAWFRGAGLDGSS